MSDEKRHNWGLIIDVLDVLEQHGYHKGDDQHTGRAVGLIRDLAHIYEGTQETPTGGYTVPTLQPRRSSPELGPTATSSTEAIAGAGMHTILAALDEASDYKRDRAECCADCADQSCSTCQHRLEAAEAYDSLAVRLMRAMESSVADKTPPQPPDAAPRDRIRAEAVAEREAGQ